MTTDSMSFALNGVEVGVIALWVVGIVCAVWATRYLTSRRSLLLIVVAVFVPVVGSIAVIVRFTVLVWSRRRPTVTNAFHDREH